MRKLRTILLVATGIALVAGCVDEIPDFGLDLHDPAIASMVPPHGAVDVDREVTVMVVLTEPLDLETVGTDALQLFAGETPVDGLASYVAGSTSLTFSPDGPLAYFSEFTAVLSSSLEDRVGRKIEPPLSWDFRTRDNSWRDTLVLSTASEEAPVPVVHQEPLGRAVAVWHELRGPRYEVVAAGYLPGAGWSEPQIIDDSVADEINPRAVIASDGTAFAIWVHSGSTNDLWGAARNLAGWTSPTLLETLTDGVHGYDLAPSPGSGARVAWSQNNGTTNEIFSRMISNSGSLGPVEPVATSGSNTDSDLLSLAVAPDERAVIAFTSYDGMRRNLSASRYVPGSGWESAELLETFTDGIELVDVLFVGDDAFVAYVVRNAADNARSLWSNRLADGVWEGPERIDSDEWNLVRSARLAPLPDGGVLATWSDGTGSTRGVWWNIRLPGTGGWQTAQQLTSNMPSLNDVDLATDPRGNAVVLFRPDNDGVMRSIRFLAEVWGAPEDFSALPFGSSADVTLNASGEGLAIWSSDTNGTGRVVSRTFR